MAAIGAPYAILEVDLKSQGSFPVQKLGWSTMAHNGLLGPPTKFTMVRSIPPGLKRLGANLAMLVKEIELLRTNPDQIWIHHC